MISVLLFSCFLLAILLFFRVTRSLDLSLVVVSLRVLQCICILRTLVWSFPLYVHVLIVSLFCEHAIGVAVGVGSLCLSRIQSPILLSSRRTGSPRFCLIFFFGVLFFLVSLRPEAIQRTKRSSPLDSELSRFIRFDLERLWSLSPFGWCRSPFLSFVRVGYNV